MRFFPLGWMQIYLDPPGVWLSGGSLCTLTYPGFEPEERSK